MWYWNESTRPMVPCLIIFLMSCIAGWNRKLQEGTPTCFLFFSRFSCAYPLSVVGCSTKKCFPFLAAYKRYGECRSGGVEIISTSGVTFLSACAKVEYLSIPYFLRAKNTV